ncbi:hypothetical protein N9A94_05085 [Akkermansiaceae bacterium]|nr:hypothetical protein [Akkermansiaceae bacterium]MDA7888830.1 hypothetical protein [Akkermansiaceae bacterium]MDB4537129.1 hypothetical protein [Akkermansiaceae bacterium]
MKLFSYSILFAMTSVMMAEDTPESYSPGRYVELVKNSPFTDPIEIGDPPAGPKELEDWSLIGVRKYRDEQFVTVVNLKDRSKRIEIPGDEADSLGFSLLEVEVARSFLNTRAKVQKGEEEAWLEYDSKLLRAKKAPQKATPVKGVSKKTPPPAPGKRVRYVPRPK